MMEEPAGGGPLEPTSDERTWGALTHLAALSAVVSIVGMVVGPLVVWLIKREQLPFVERAGKEALNFNISFFLYGVVAGILIFALIGLLLLPAVAIAWLVLVIMASVRASNGEDYRYPLTIRFIR